MRRFLFIAAGAMLLSVWACGSDEPDTVLDDNNNGEVVDNNDDLSADNEWGLSHELSLTSADRELLADWDAFNYQLLLNCEKASHESFGVSPVSVAIYLGMVANATDGETPRQIAGLLNATDINALNSLNEKLMHYLPSAGNGVILDINNRVWLADRFKAPENTVNLLKTTFNADIDYVDFGIETTVPYINGWISDRTRGLISSILDGEWNRYVRTTALLANTVYFKGEWQSKFDAAATDRALFHAAAGDRTVDMMHQNLITEYFGNDRMQKVSLPYSGNICSIELYLPAEGVSLAEMLEDMQPAGNGIIGERSASCDVTVSLPKFTVRNSLELDGILYGMGLKSLQSSNMSPLGVNETTGLNTIHKTFISVDEEGTEIAAVTGGLASLPGPDTEYQKVSVTLDRPFVYIVRNNMYGITLMAGVVR